MPSNNIARTDPPYMQVVAQIRQRIASGELREGDRVPSAREITREWGVSLATATKVLAALRSEGLARGVVGVGTIVAASARPTPRDHIGSTHGTGRIYPKGDFARITAAELVPAPEHVAEALRIEPDSSVIRRRRVTYRDERPISASTSWFSGALAEVAPLLTVTERLPQGTPGYIEEVSGRRVTSGRDQVSARPATAAEAAELGIDVGVAILDGRNWYFDTDGNVVEYGEYIGPGDRWLTYDYPVN